MGGFSIWHIAILVWVLAGVAGFLPLLIRPSGPNRFGPSAKPLNLFQAMRVCVQKYFDFGSRAARSEYWWFYLVSSLVSLGIFAADVTGLNFPALHLLSLLFFVPMLSTGVRRLHDINRSGWWMLLLASGFGNIGLIVLPAWPSQTDTTAEVF